MTANAAYQAIAAELAALKQVSTGSLFGKACVKLGTKAFVAFHKDEMVFKIPLGLQTKILALKGAHLWDPSGAGRPMKEWICLPFAHAKVWAEFADQARRAAAEAAK